MTLEELKEVFMRNKSKDAPRKDFVALKDTFPIYSPATDRAGLADMAEYVGVEGDPEREIKLKALAALARGK